MKRILLVLLLLAAPAGASAQSLFAGRGLGVPLEAVDARARVLGGIGVGLIGVNPSLVNPAELSAQRRGVTAVLQPATHRIQLGEGEADVASTRFPLLSLLYPVNSRLLLGIGYGGYLEQSWGVRNEGTVPVGGADIPFTDVIRSRGGLSQVRLSAAYALTPELSIGVAGGLITGSLERNLVRTFQDSTLALGEFTTSLRWEYNGPLGVIGAAWQPNPALRIGASLAMTGDIDADSADGGAQARTYGGGMTATFGASGQLTPDLMLALGGARQRFPEIDSDVELSRETWAVGGGVEYTGLRSGARTFPFRIGARWQQLPYYGAGEEPATEISYGAGLGFRLASDQTGPLAVLDTGIERVQRSGLEGAALGDGIDESLWRWTVSLSLFGR